jgi:hypothetical protein
VRGHKEPDDENSLISRGKHSVSRSVIVARRSIVPSPLSSQPASSALGTEIQRFTSSSFL